MEGNGQTPSDIIVCGRCEAACDPADRFCRQCGLYLHDSHLPSLWDEPKPPVAWRPAPASAVAKGAAIVAAGTVAEILLRRLLRGAFSRREDPGSEAQRQIVVAGEPNGTHEETEVVSETFLLRRVRFRR